MGRGVRVSRDRARCNARAALYKQHVGRRSPRSSQGHPGNVPMPPMQDKFSHSTESVGRGLEGAQRWRARARATTERAREEVEVRLGHAVRRRASPCASEFTETAAVLCNVPVRNNDETKVSVLRERARARSGTSKQT